MSTSLVEIARATAEDANLAHYVGKVRPVVRHEVRVRRALGAGGVRDREMAHIDAGPRKLTQVADWQNVREFTLGNVERPATRGRNRIEWGPNAIRIPEGSKDDSVLTPCAYVGPDRSLYLDADLTRLLCVVDQTAEDAWAVRDDQGVELGTITRIPSSRPLLRANWRIEQPGHPELVGRTEWLSGKPARLAAKAASRLIVGVLDGLTGIGDEGGDQPTRDRTLEWRAGAEVAMYSEGTALISIRAEWLDRRLAFAYTLVGR